MRCDYKNAMRSARFLEKNWPLLGEELSNSCARTRSLERLSRWTDKKTVRVESLRSFPSIGTCSLFDGKRRVEESRLRGEYKWRKRSEGRRGCRRGRRSPLTSRQSGAAEVSMTPVRRRSADAARRVAHRLSSEEIIMVFRAIQSENTISDRFLRRKKSKMRPRCRKRML